MKYNYKNQVAFKCLEVLGSLEKLEVPQSVGIFANIKLSLNTKDQWMSLHLYILS